MRRNKATIPVKRICYSIISFDRYEECYEKMTDELEMKGDNTIKKAFRSYKIDYYFTEDGELQIIVPDNSSKLKSLLKLIKDGAAKTCLLEREILTGRAEEF